MNPDPHLTLTLSPPIRWERRGNSRRAQRVTRETGSLRQVQGFNARSYRGNLSQQRTLFLSAARTNLHAPHHHRARFHYQASRINVSK